MVLEHPLASTDGFRQLAHAESLGGIVRKLRWLDTYLGELMLDDITLNVIDRIKAEKLKVAGKPTVNRYLALVRSILLRARNDWEWVERVPKVKLYKEGPGRERSITVEQAEALLRELPTHQRDVVLFALATGLRQSNVVGLAWSHVNLVAAHAWVGTNQSKNGKPIAVPLNATALAVCCGGKSESMGEGIHLRPKAARLGQYEGVEECLKRAGIENFPLARLEAHVGVVASPIGNADPRAATFRRLALVGDGRTLCASCARPSRDRRQQDRFAARRLRYGHARNEQGIGGIANPLMMLVGRVGIEPTTNGLRV